MTWKDELRELPEEWRDDLARYFDYGEEPRDPTLYRMLAGQTNNVVLELYPDTDLARLIRFLNHRDLPKSSWGKLRKMGEWTYRGGFETKVKARG